VRVRSAPERGERIFVLAGGANLGSTQAGQLHELAKAGIVPDRVIGCSVGSINGVFFAVEPTLERGEQLMELWLSSRPASVFASNKLHIARKLARRADHLVENDRLLQMLASDLGVARLEDTTVPVEVLATDLVTGREAWFAEGDAVSAVAASCALPGVFPPVRIGDGVYVDGGVISPCPVARAYRRQPAEVWVLDTPTRPWEVPARMHALEVLLRSFAVACRDDDIHPGTPTGTRLMHMHTRIPEEMHIGFDDFSHTTELIEIGAASARVCIEEYHSGALRTGRRRFRITRPRHLDA